MVHALSEVHRVLKPGGRLIDLRPTMRNRRVELELSSARLFLSEIDSSSSFPDHVVANDTLETAIAEGKFAPEHRALFAYVSDLDTVEDLRDFKAGLHRSVMPESMFQQIETLTTCESTDYMIRIHREMLIARYHKLSGSC